MAGEAAQCPAFCGITPHQPSRIMVPASEAFGRSQHTLWLNWIINITWYIYVTKFYYQINEGAFLKFGMLPTNNKGYFLTNKFLHLKFLKYSGLTVTVLSLSSFFRQTLQQHMTRHTGKLFECNKLDCIFTARSQSELNAHQLTHSANKPFSCVKCDYSGKTKSQLLR